MENAESRSLLRQLVDDRQLVGRVAFLTYAELCGATLARAHDRSGDAAAISGYLGKGNAFGKALGRFATLYADQNARDHAALVQAIKDGQLPAESNV